MLITLKEWKAWSAAQAEARANLISRARAAFGLAEDDALSINQLACSDPGCPDVETVILVMRQRCPTRAVKIQKAMSDITDDDPAEVQHAAAVAEGTSCAPGA